MARWFRTKIDEVRRGLRPLPPSPDIHFDVLISPYSIPSKISSEKRPRGPFVLTFHYIDGEEPGRDIRIDEHIRVVEGKRSGRLLQLLLDVDAIDAGAITMNILRSRVESAWQEVAKHKDINSLEYAAAKKAVETTTPELFEVGA